MGRGDMIFWIVDFFHTLFSLGVCPYMFLKKLKTRKRTVKMTFKAPFLPFTFTRAFDGPADTDPQIDKFQEP